MFLLILLAGISTFSLTSTLLSYTQPFFLLSSRMGLAGILLLLYAYLKKELTLNKKHIYKYAQLVVFAIFLPYALRYYGLKTTNNTQQALFLYNLGPVATYLLTHLLGIELATKKRSLALALCFAGLIVSGALVLPTFFSPTISQSTTEITIPAVEQTIPQTTLQSLSQPGIQHPMGLPELAIILSLFSFSFGWIIMRKCIIDYAYKPATINGITMLGGGVIALIASFFLETTPYVTNITSYIPTLALVILISNVIAYNLYAYAVTRYSLTFIQISYWLPIMLKSNSSLSIYMIGSLVFLFGLFLFYAEEKEGKQILNAIADKIKTKKGIQKSAS